MEQKMRTLIIATTALGVQIRSRVPGPYSYSQPVDVLVFEMTADEATAAQRVDERPAAVPAVPAAPVAPAPPATDAPPLTLVQSGSSSAPAPVDLHETVVTTPATDVQAPEPPSGGTQ